MDKALLDTDILSEVLKGIDPHVVARAAPYRAAFGHYTVSLVSVVEPDFRLDHHRRPCYTAGQQLSSKGDEGEE